MAEHPKCYKKIDENVTLIIEVGKPTLGFGAFGSVYLGHYQFEECALKILKYDAIGIRTNHYPSKDQEEKKKEIESFLRECATLENFKHKNVVQHLNTTVHPISHNPVLVMELLDCNLSTFVTSDKYKNTLTLQCEISISRDMACGLEYIHDSHRIIHRDLCGENILLKLNGQNIPVAKIADFGLSKLFDPFKKNTTQHHRRGYLPPEAFHEEYDENGKLKEYDLSLDIFSCGVIMMQIALRLNNVKDRHERKSCLDEFESEVCMMFPHPLKHCIIDCLKEDKNQRPSAKKLYGELEKCLPYGVSDTSVVSDSTLNNSGESDMATGD